MHKFEDFESFVRFVENDINKVDYNPVRFINIDTMPTWVKVKAYLQTKVEQVFKLSEYCENADIAPNLFRLKRDTRLSDKSTLIIPLSEYLRINAPIAFKTIYDFLHANYEKIQNGKTRIYIPLYRMGSILQNIEIGPKEENCIINFVETEDSDYALTIVQNNLIFKSTGNDIEGFRKYFVYWEQNPDKPIILHTNMAVNYEDIVFSDNVEVIVNAYGLLRHHGLPAILTEEMGDELKWEKMLNVFVENSTLDSKFSQALRVSKYNDNLFKSWSNYSSYEKWLLWLWARLHSTNEYLTNVLQHDKNSELFEKDIIKNIRDYIDSSSFGILYAQRKKIIVDMTIKLNFDDIQNYFSTLCAKDVVRCMTDSSKEERINTLLKVCELDDYNILQNAYPLLYNYLGKSIMDDEYLENYFDLYKMSKVKNLADHQLLEMVKENGNNGCIHIWKLESRNYIVNKIYDTNSTVFFVDAFGAEYVSAFNSCFEENEYNIDSYYGHCNLPAVTEHNNDFYKDKNHMEPYYDLDHWKHSKCTFPESLEMELHHIEKIAAIVKKQLDIGKYSKVILAADHGTSRFVFTNKGKSHQANESATIYKYGRYCKDSISKYDDIEGCIHQDDYWIFANYDKFIQKGAPVCEVHGGASIEEMVVPVLVISKATSSNVTERIEIIVLNPEINLSIDKKITVEFKVSIQFTELYVSVSGERYDCNYDGNKYYFEQIITDKRNEYIGKVISNGKIIGEIKYNVIRPVQNNRKFDL